MCKRGKSQAASVACLDARRMAPDKMISDKSGGRGGSVVTPRLCWSCSRIFFSWRLSSDKLNIKRPQGRLQMTLYCIFISFIESAYLANAFFCCCRWRQSFKSSKSERNSGVLYVCRNMIPTLKVYKTADIECHRLMGTDQLATTPGNISVTRTCWNESHNSSSVFYGGWQWLVVTLMGYEVGGILATLSKEKDIRYPNGLG